MAARIEHCRTAALLLALIAAAGCARHENEIVPARTPQAVVRDFYEWRVRTPAAGFPAQEQLDEIRPYLSDELYELMSATAAKQAKLTGKPPARRTFTDGDAFSSLSAGPTSFVAGDVEDDRGNLMVAVQLTAAHELPAVHWVDRVRVAKQGERYVIADIHYANHWSVGTQTLVATLKKQGKRRRA